MISKLQIIKRYFIKSDYNSFLHLKKNILSQSFAKQNILILGNQQLDTSLCYCQLMDLNLYEFSFQCTNVFILRNVSSINQRENIARWLNWVVRMKYILNAFSFVVVKLEEEKCWEKKLLEQFLVSFSFGQRKNRKKFCFLSDSCQKLNKRFICFKLQDLK